MTSLGFRRPGEAEKFKPQNVVPTEKGKGVSIMVWGCFAGNICGPLVSWGSEYGGYLYRYNAGTPRTVCRFTHFQA